MMRCYNCMKEYPDGYDICPHCGYDRNRPAENLYYLLPGTVLSGGRYLVGAAINAGGFGIVYKAWDSTLDKMIAIKEYYPGGIAARTPGTAQVLVYSNKRLKEYEDGKARFLNEARKVARFNAHPSIVDVYDFFEDNNTAYMVMEYMNGMTYKSYIKEQGGKVSQQIAVSVTLAVLDALKEVHKIKIIHRDINPSNIFICRNGMVKLFDFGAARIEATEMSTVLTPHYAPPEQYSTGGKQGPYTDIYAVGATAYFALTGIKPEESTDRVQKDELAAPHDLDPEIPVELSNTIMRAMALKEELRFQNTDQFRDALMNKGPVRNVEEEIRRRRKLRVIQAASALLLLATAGGGCYLYYRRQLDQTTLKPTAIQVWLAADENDTVESAAARFEEMSQAFRENYGQVEIQVTAVPSREYEEKINQAASEGTLPDLFDSTLLNPEHYTQLQPLDETLNLLKDNSPYLFLDQYQTLFPEKKQMPLCFQIPVIYTRGAAEAAGEMSELVLDGYDELKDGDACSYSVKADDLMLYDELLGEGCSEEYEKIAQENGADMFASGYQLFKDNKVKYYLSDTSDYQMLTEDLPMEFGVQFPKQENCVIRPDHLWSVSAVSGEDQKKASEWLISYMLTDSAQRVLGVKSLEGIPLSRNMCDLFAQVYQKDLEKVKDYAETADVKDSRWIGESIKYKR
ncbi:MAG: serine/threonine-protein kinase [Lachnospiraceae bacterium]|nr:serine/threonine-protein kinase [Lachnospiraceae bacterium]